MAGRFSDVATAVGVTGPAPSGADFVWIANTGGGAITITAPGATKFMGGGTGYSLPAGKRALLTHVPGGAFWRVKEGA